MTTAVEMIRDNYARRQTLNASIREVAEKATTEERAYSEEETAHVAELRAELDAVDGRLTAALETEIRSQQIADSTATMLGLMATNDGTLHDTRSIGERYVSTDEYRAFADGNAPKGGRYPALELADFDLRAVTTATTATTSAGALNPREHIARIGSDFLDRRTYLLDVLPHINVGNGVIEYVQDTTPLADLANKAAETTESTGAKPQAGITLALVTENAATIAHYAKITRQAAADSPQVMGYLDTRLRYGLKRRADQQAISGDGTAPNLSGLLDRSGILTYAPAGAEARYISIRHGIRLMEDAEAVPEIVVLNPADAELFDLSNAATAGLHATPDLVSAGASQAWGLRQVRSTAVTAGTAILIDPLAVAVFDRMGATAYMTDSDSTDFRNNIVTLLLEMRMGLGLFEPKGVLAITFNGTA